MRTVPSGLLESLTRCYAVKVIRQDAVVWGLTDANVPFTYSGVTYQVYNGFTASQLEQQIGTSAGDLEIQTIESVVASQITPGDVIANFYENARVWVYEFDYLNPSIGPLIKGQYFFTKATIHDSSVQITLSDILFRLRNVTGRTIGSNCDVERFGNPRCDPSGTIRAARSYNRTVTTVSSNNTFEVSDSNPVGFYNFGEVLWLTGANTGSPDADIKVHLTPSSGVAQLVLSTPMGYPIQVGDTCTLVGGCDRTLATCKSIANSHNPSGTNVENFQGFTLPIPDDLNRVGRQAGM
jgi:uncharacterized phage protein (TIGR02218 family)